MSIAAVEQATGIARATLRIWERRYGFPQPGRDARDERTYTQEDLRRLRLIAGLLEQGHRPGRLIKLSGDELAALGNAAPAVAGSAGGPGADTRLADEPVLDLLRRHETAALAKHLDEELRELGLEGFVTRRLPGLNRCIGTGWACGDLEVYQEHLYTETIQLLLRNRLAAAAPPNGGGPRVLLATFPEESHGLGLLMVQAVLAEQGCDCVSLGVRVPLAQVLSAAAGFEADVVGLSFSASVNPTQVQRGLAQLRSELPLPVAIWAGGSAPVLYRGKIAGVTAVRDIAQVPGLVAQWQAERTS